MLLTCFSCVWLFVTPWTVGCQAAPGVHGVLQARILEWAAISSSRGSSWHRDQTWVSCSSSIAGGFLTIFHMLSPICIILLCLKIGEGNGTPLQYSCLENPMDGGAWKAAVHGVARVGHDWVTSLSLFTFLHWRRKWQPTPLFLPGESQGWQSLVGRRLWGRTKSDTAEVT